MKMFDEHYHNLLLENSKEDGSCSILLNVLAFLSIKVMVNLIKKSFSIGFTRKLSKR